jgi:hypothetical protein
LELVTQNQNSHFFLDEVLISANEVSSELIAEISTELISEISETIFRDNYFWIACQSDRTLPSRSNHNLKGKSVLIIHNFLCKW